MAIYRKKRGGNAWHWCKNCGNYPTSDYVTRDTRPGYDLCNQCKSKEKENNCRK